MFARRESEVIFYPAGMIKTIVQNLSYKLLVYCILYIIDKNVLNFISSRIKKVSFNGKPYT